MKYAIIKRESGTVMEMNFESEEELDNWLEINPSFENLGVIDYSLPMRHVRIQTKE